jgi:hypothetical protein
MAAAPDPSVKPRGCNIGLNKSGHVLRGTVRFPNKVRGRSDAGHSVRGRTEDRQAIPRFVPGTLLNQCPLQQYSDNLSNREFRQAGRSICSILLLLRCLNKIPKAPWFLPAEMLGWTSYLHTAVHITKKHTVRGPHVTFCAGKLSRGALQNGGSRWPAASSRRLVAP